jgi:hypothetical protein
MRVCFPVQCIEGLDSIVFNHLESGSKRIPRIFLSGSQAIRMNILP